MAPMDDGSDSWAYGLRGDHLREPPAGTIARAVALAAMLPARRLGLTDRLVELIFDSAATPLPAGIRGVASSERRLLYQIRREGTDKPDHLDLRLREESGGKLEVVGQLLPPPRNGRVHAHVGRSRRVADVGASGEFVIRGIPRSAAALRIEITVPGGPTVVVKGVPMPVARRGPGSR